MNPASLTVVTLEENYLLVMIIISSLFAYFVYNDFGRQIISMDGIVDGNIKNTNNGDGGEYPDSCHDDEEDPDSAPPPALPVSPPIAYQPLRVSDADLEVRAREYYKLMDGRRTVRSFSSDPVPDQVLRDIIMTAGTSPSGAHTQPWTFVLVKDENTKRAIRSAVEEEERLNYERRMSKQWTSDLRPLGTTWKKPYLTTAPAIILLFRRVDPRHYYSEMSVAIAAGILLAAIHYAGLVSLTSTPLHCGARLRALLARPTTERLALLLPVGRAAPDCTVPDLQRKSYHDICVEF